MEFLEENGPDTLINCISANFRTWDAQRGAWKLNDDKVSQKKFMDALHMRISHFVEKPSYTDRGIQVKKIS